MLTYFISLRRKIVEGGIAALLGWVVRDSLIIQQNYVNDEQERE